MSRETLHRHRTWERGMRLPKTGRALCVEAQGVDNAAAVVHFTLDAADPQVRGEILTGPRIRMFRGGDLISGHDLTTMRFLGVTRSRRGTYYFYEDANPT